MKKRSQERQMPTDQETTPPAPAGQTAPPPAEVKAPEIKTCTICERPLPCAVHDRPVAALANLEDGPQVSKAFIEEAPEKEEFDLPQPRTLEELHERIRAHRQPKPAYVPPPRTERQQAQLEAEMAAGRRSTERAEARQAFRPPPQRDRTEGTNNPVKRPGDVDEYRNSFKRQVQTQSKDAR